MATGIPTTFPTEALARLRAAILLVAIHTGRSIDIGGAGTCDVFGIEMVYVIDAL
jgi:hypothetical protein